MKSKPRWMKGVTEAAKAEAVSLAKPRLKAARLTISPKSAESAKV